jgi:hypothetical protein
MNVDNETLSAYADGELDVQSAAAVAAAVAADPDLARRLAEHRALRDRLRAAYAPVLAEPVPERLASAARGVAEAVEARVDVAGHDSGQVVDLRSWRRAPRGGLRSPLQWAALAASLAVGLALGPILYSSLTPAPLVDVTAGMRARGVLDEALSLRLAADAPAADGVRIGVSFRSRTGQFCRTFATSGGDAIEGLACRDAQGWRLQLLERRSSGTDGDSRYLPAASTVSPTIRSAIETQIAGEPLDAEAERAARDTGWTVR